MNYEITEQCLGCDHIHWHQENEDQGICEVWMSPNAKWSLGQCPTDTKYRETIVEDQRSKNPLKASKQKARRR